MARILYIEDDATQRNSNAASFRAAGHEVTECRDYRQAQPALRDSLVGEAYDIVVSDGQYPGDGKRFTRGAHDRFQGSACLLHDHKLLGLSLPVVVATAAPDYLEKHPYPSHCTQPVRIVDKRGLPRDGLAAVVAGILGQVKPG